MNDITGKIHSLESFGTVDGPGIRYIVFLQGCPLRCQYCHNPDSWQLGDEKMTISSSALLSDILKHKNFYSPKGGVTFSGGEPLMQLEFVRQMVALLKAEHLHSTIDTSGYLFNRNNKEMLHFFKEEVDLTLLDIKAFNEADYANLTGAKLQPTLELLEFLSEHNRPVWVRYVVVPGLTDSLTEAKKLATYLSGFKNIEQVEVLPFHKMGEFKWHELGLNYQLASTPSCPPELSNAIRDIFIEAGLKAR